MTKKAKATQPKKGGSNNSANIYTLSAKSKKLAPKQIKAATHRGAITLALRKLGSAPFADVLAEVAKQKKIETTMDLGKAIRWMLMDMTRKGWATAR